MLQNEASGSATVALLHLLILEHGMTPLRIAIPTMSLAFLWFPLARLDGANERLAERQDRAAWQPPQIAKHGADDVGLPRGKKLILRDGSFQLAREYERKGDRVRYYSVERKDWEEIPAAMVDWDATARAEAESEKSTAAMLSKIHSQEEASRMEAVMDVDASLQVAPSVFLPPGEGMFVVEGKSVTPLGQVGSQVKMDKKTFLKQVLSPIPIVPGKRNVEIAGAKSKTRITSSTPEFYLREAPPDPDRVSSVEHSSRPGESGPEVELVHAVVKGNKRQLESIRSMFGQDIATERKDVPMERWEVAATVYRFTLGEPLPPGEYALAEILPDGMNLFVWDFGVDGPPPAKQAKH
jgi:hypothetical protein